MGGRADVYLARFEGEPALQAYEDELTANPGDGAAAAGRVRALWLLRRYRRARYELRRLLADFPRWPEAHVAEGDVALGERDDALFLGVLDGSSQRDTDKARSAYSEALRLDPACMLAWRGLASTARLDGDPDQALALLAKAEGEVGYEPGLFLERAMCARDAGHLRNALSHARQAAWQAPHCVEVRIVEARLLLELGRPNDAAKALDALANANLHCAPFYLTAARMFNDLVLGNSDSSMRNAIRAARESAFAATWRDVGCGPSEIAWALNSMASLKNAYKAYRHALEDAPGSPLLHVEFAELLGNIEGEGLTAVKETRLATAVDPAYVPARVAEARALMDIGRTVEAAALVRALIEQHPGLGCVRHVAQDLENHQGCFEAALAHATAAREDAPDHPESSCRVIQELISLGDIATAEQQVHAAIEQWPGDPRLRGQEASSALAEERHCEALRRLKRAECTGDRDDRIHRQETQVRRWMFWHPVSFLLGKVTDAVAIRRLGAAAASPYRGRDRLPDTAGTRVTGWLRQLDWDAARSYARADFSTSVLLLILGSLGLILAFLYGPNWIAHLAGFPRSIYYYDTSWDLLFIAFTAAVVFYLLRGRRIRTSSSVACVAAFVIVLYSAIGHSDANWPHNIWVLTVIIDVALTTLAVSIYFLLKYTRDLITRTWERRAAHRHPIAAMISGLLEVSALLTDELLADTGNRIRCLRLIEDVAQAQERALNQALGEGVGHADPVIAQEARRWAAYAAVATRRFKEEILAPGPVTATSLASGIQRPGG